MSHTGSQVNTDLPRDAVIGSQEWKTLKEFFTHFYGEFEFRRTWQNLCEYYEETEGKSQKIHFPTLVDILILHNYRLE